MTKAEAWLALNPEASTSRTHLASATTSRDAFAPHLPLNGRLGEEPFPQIACEFGRASPDPTPYFLNNTVGAISLQSYPPSLYPPVLPRLLYSDTRNNASNVYKYCALMNALNRNVTTKIYNWKGQGVSHTHSIPTGRCKGRNRNWN